jgi:hypothetical protein
MGGHGQTKPSTRLLAMLHHDLPWAAVLDAPAVIAAHSSGLSDLAPVPHAINKQLRDALHQRDRAVARTQYAYSVHVESSWLDRARDRSQDRGYGLEL